MKDDIQKLRHDHSVERFERFIGQRRNFGLSVTSLILLLTLAMAIWVILGRAGLL